jgi:hypothetical protein
MDIFMFNALSKKSGTVAAYFTHTSFFTHTKTNSRTSKFWSHNLLGEYVIGIYYHKPLTKNIDMNV